MQKRAGPGTCMLATDGPCENRIFARFNLFGTRITAEWDTIDDRVLAGIP